MSALKLLSWASVSRRHRLLRNVHTCQDRACVLLSAVKLSSMSTATSVRLSHASHVKDPAKVLHSPECWGFFGPEGFPCPSTGNTRRVTKGDVVNGLRELLPSPSSGGLSELGVGVAIGLGFGFEGKPLDKATRKAASLFPDARCGCRVGEVIV